MSEIDRLTITLPAELVAIVQGAVERGDYASSSEVVREALRDWKVKRALQLEELAVLKADIERGLADVEQGRVPLSGPARDHLAPGLRVTFHKSYAVYYMPLPDAVVIVRITHGARDIAAIAGQGGFG